MKPYFIIPAILILSAGAASAADVTTFLSPDCSEEALSGFIAEASTSLMVASYTLSSGGIAGELLGKGAAGVNVTVMVDAGPAGGIQDAEKAALCDLVAGNVTVLMYGGPASYMHAKYAVRDGAAAMVTSENFGEAGFPPSRSRGNRGWGAVIEDAALSSELAAVFAEDAGGSKPFRCPEGNHSPGAPAGSGRYRRMFGSEAFPGQRAEIVASPDSLGRLLALIESANESIRAQQFYVYPRWGSERKGWRPNPLLEALISEARSGVSVRLLLDSSYFNMEPGDNSSNAATIKYVNGIAADEGIPIEAKAIDLDGLGLYEAHNKGLVIDGRAALVSSINWNENSVMNNREIGVIITGDAAGYFARAFDSDWGPAGRDEGFGFLPAMASLAAVVIIIIYFYRRMY